jgi:hypothetical protein
MAMSGMPEADSNKLAERDEMRALLAWHAAGTLDAKEAARLEAYLTAHPEMARHIELAREEMFEIIGGNEAAGAPAPGALARLMEAIEAEPRFHAHQRRRKIVHGLSRWSDWIAGLSPGRLATAAAVAGLVLLAQAASITWLLTWGAPVTYETASGGKDAIEEGTFALIGFTDNASAAAIGTLLSRLGASIVEGPKPGGLYRVRIAAQALPEAEAKALIDRIAGERDIVRVIARAR